MDDKLINNQSDAMIAICGMYRTRHHYISQFITKNIKMNTIIDQQLSNNGIFLQNYNKNAMNYNFNNNLYVSDIENPDEKNVNHFLTNAKCDNKCIILVIRDPFNNYSSVKNHNNIYSDYKKSWIMYYHNTIDLYNSGVVNLVINYDKFITNLNYKKLILSKLSININDYNEIFETTLDGYGSTFNGFNTVKANDLCDRKKYLTEEDINYIKNDEKIMKFFFKEFNNISPLN
jgi:hypothetical protein